MNVCGSGVHVSDLHSYYMPFAIVYVGKEPECDVVVLATFFLLSDVCCQCMQCMCEYVRACNAVAVVVVGAVVALRICAYTDKRDILFFTKNKTKRAATYNIVFVHLVRVAAYEPISMCIL